MALQADEATVLRDRKLITLPAAQLVPGDIVEVAGKLAALLLSLLNEFSFHNLPQLISEKLLSKTAIVQHADRNVLTIYV